MYFSRKLSEKGRRISFSMSGNVGESVNDNLIKSETLFDQEPGKMISETRDHIVKHLIIGIILMLIMQNQFLILQRCR